MKDSFRRIRAVFVAWVLVIGVPLCASAMTAQEIVDQAVKQGLGESWQSRHSSTISRFPQNLFG
jgi:hypothetical protein